MKFGIILLTLVVGLALWQTITSESTDRVAIDLENAVLIDVRSPQEFAGGHVTDAVNLPIDTISEAAVSKLASKDQTIILYCHSGGRAAAVHKRMTKWGFSNVHNLKTQSGVQKVLNQQ